MKARYPAFLNGLIGLYLEKLPRTKRRKPEIVDIQIVPPMMTLVIILETERENTRMQEICVEGSYSNFHDQILYPVKTTIPSVAEIGHLEQVGTLWRATYVARDQDRVAIWRGEHQVSASVKSIQWVYDFAERKPRFLAEQQDGMHTIFRGEQQISVSAERISDVCFVGNDVTYRATLKGRTQWYRGETLDPQGSPYAKDRPRSYPPIVIEA